MRIVDALDDTKPGFHPLSDSLTALMRRAQPGIAYRHPAEQWYGLATIVYANGSWGHTGTIENTHAMVVHRPDGMTWAITVSGNVPDEHRGPRRDLPGRPRSRRDRRPGTDDLDDHDDEHHHEHHARRRRADDVHDRRVTATEDRHQRRRGCKTSRP